MAEHRPPSNENDKLWNDVVKEVISCVSKNFPNDEVLASYLGEDIKNKYRVSHFDHRMI